MKKLLSLLSVLTISGTAVPTTIAASPYQKEENLENLNRIKRDCNRDYNSIEQGGTFIKTYYVSLIPKTFKDIINSNNKNPNNYENFNKDVQNILFTTPALDFSQIHSGGQYTYNELENVIKSYANIIAGAIWNDWNKVISVWNNGDKKHRIRMVIDSSFSNGGYWITSVNMRNDEEIPCN